MPHLEYVLKGIKCLSTTSGHSHLPISLKILTHYDQSGKSSLTSIMHTCSGQPPYYICLLVCCILGKLSHPANINLASEQDYVTLNLGEQQDEASHDPNKH